ncbi:MAG: hypothetical protein D6820_03235 [Lentisphaerae bacterium]|nr:MAG: hypothetical protein D6820_03235 [Lentisphaerota bacterium]
MCGGGSAGGQLAAATAMISDPQTNHADDDLKVSCVPNAVILWNPWFKCEPKLAPPAHIRSGLPPFLIFCGGQDPGIPVSEMQMFLRSLQAAGVKARLCIGHKGRHGFCNGRKPRNRFFYWSLTLCDRFLSEQGILTGHAEPVWPQGVSPLGKEEYEIID